MHYLALLRGINVGGNNIIKKEELKALFESVGCTDVVTYIQSGNIVFSSTETHAELMRKIAAALQEKMGKDIPLVIHSKRAYERMMDQAPSQWNEDPGKKYNALFLLGGIKLQEALNLFPTVQQPYEELHGVPGVLFWSGSKKDYSKTAYVKDLAKSPLYKLVTIRNGNTTIKLRALLHEKE